MKDAGQSGAPADNVDWRNLGMLAEEIVSDLLTREVLAPSAARPPSSPGFYAWWCREEQLNDAFPSIPKENRPPVPTAWSLIYVGISPSGPTSSRNIAIRLAKDHAGGNIGGSTFRQSLAALLTGSLGLEPRRGSDRSRLASEVPLSRWIESACGVTFATAERPWEFETDVIAILNPPLNIDCGTHPFRLEVKARRAALRQACGLGA
jgi:hypothetical protein